VAEPGIRAPHTAAGLDIGPRTHGIRVNAVAPQLLDTANWATFPAEMMTHAVAPEAIAFPISDDAAPVSGAIPSADGA
jgi:NAD(P)-dependent dehydrogenase (short-subunit alcohol dehydrogenase family)